MNAGYVMPIWVQYVQVLGAPIVAVFAAVVAFIIQRRQVKIADQMRSIASAQYATADQKLRLDLFQLRFKVFENILNRISQTLEYKEGNEVHMNRFREAIAPVAYLFDHSTHIYLALDVADHLNTYMRVTAESEVTSDMRMANDHPEHKRHVEREWLLQQQQELHNRLGKYLSVKAVGDLN